MKWILIILTLILANCGIFDDTDHGYTLEDCQGNYYQAEGLDTAWWTFYVEGDKGYILGALRRKIKNAPGWMPVMHTRGVYIISKGYDCRFFMYSRCTFNYTIDENGEYWWNGDPEDYNTPYSQPTIVDFTIAHWDTDSILLLDSMNQDFEAEKWTGKSLMDPTHPAYQESGPDTLPPTLSFTHPVQFPNDSIIQRPDIGVLCPICQQSSLVFEIWSSDCNCIKYECKRCKFTWNKPTH